MYNILNIDIIFTILYLQQTIFDDHFLRIGRSEFYITLFCPNKMSLSTKPISQTTCITINSTSTLLDSISFLLPHPYV